MEILTLNEAAARLGKTAKWLRSECANGYLHGKKCGMAWVVTPADLDAYRKLNRHPGRPKGTRKRAA